MGQEIVLPDWAKKGADQAFATLNPADDNLSDGIGQSYPVISYKGKVWGMRHRGERKNFVRPDDGTPASYLDVIILGQAKQKSKSFYKKFDPNQSDGDRPICSSIDGITPDPDATTKQCDTCALCPRNVWKADPQTGKKGRECTDYKRLAVLVLPTQTQPLFGEPVLEPAFLRVPPASLNSLAIMGDTMSGQGFHYSSYVTRITFDPNEAHPKMVFRPLQGLTKAEAPVVLNMRADMNVDRIINGGYAEGIRVIPPQEGTTLLPPGSRNTGLTIDNQPSTGAVQGEGKTGTISISSPSPGMRSTNGASAQPVTPNGGNQGQGKETETSAGLGLTGLVTPPQDTPQTGITSGLATSAATPPVQSQAGSQINDTGAPEATDDELDAKIAGMLGKKN